MGAKLVAKKPAVKSATKKPASKSAAEKPASKSAAEKPHIETLAVLGEKQYSKDLPTLIKEYKDRWSDAPEPRGEYQF